MDDAAFKKDEFFRSIIGKSKSIFDRKYFKILSLKTKKDGNIQGYIVRDYEFKRSKTIVEPIDDGINKEFEILDVYELEPTNEKTLCLKYNCRRWRVKYYGLLQETFIISDSIYNGDELIYYMER